MHLKKKLKISSNSGKGVGSAYTSKNLLFVSAKTSKDFFNIKMIPYIIFIIYLCSLI